LLSYSISLIFGFWSLSRNSGKRELSCLNAREKSGSGDSVLKGSIQMQKDLGFDELGKIKKLEELEASSWGRRIEGTIKRQRKMQIKLPV
jgi:hypothetical protein